MTVITNNLFSPLISTILISFQLYQPQCSAISFPITTSGDTSRLRQSFQISSDRNRSRAKNVTIRNAKQFGVVTNRKFTDKFVNLCPSKSGNPSEDCKLSDLTAVKKHEFLEIRRKNPLESKQLSDEMEQLQNAQTGSDKELSSYLSSLVRSAADVLNLFRRIATREHTTPQQSERNIRRRHLGQQQQQQLSAFRSVRPVRRSLPMKSLPRLNHDSPQRFTPKDDIQKNLDKPKVLEDAEWAELLFGPRGVLTAVFHILDDRRKISEKIVSSSSKTTSGGSQTTDSYHQSDLSFLPDFLVNAKPIDFAKIFEAFLTGSKGDFDERISNLPELLGICNRLSCGDIYKAIDEFRKSEFFTNFQTALQLIQDPKGWEILGNLISNPELIDHFLNGAGAGNGSLENLFGSFAGAAKRSKNNSKEISPEDGDLGIDFSKMIETGAGAGGGSGGPFKKEKKPTVEELPEIAENIDAIDYYNAVESGIDTDGIETATKPDIEIAVTQSPESKKSSVGTFIIRSKVVPLPRPVLPDLSLPEIAENIDENGQTEIIIDATTPPPPDKKIWKSRTSSSSGTFHRYTSAALSRQITGVTPPRAKRPIFIITYQPVTTTVPRKQFSTTTGTTPTTPRFPTKLFVTTKRPAPISTTRATTKNFREESDYYAMYYDDNRG